ncbi:MAG: glutamate cyclase domain-containing protein [Actinomycetota bacterium]
MPTERPPSVTTDTAAPSGGPLQEQRLQCESLGTVIDALISTDFTARGLSRSLYQAAVSRAGYPLAMAAGLRLANEIHYGDPVLICTGWPSRSWLIQGLTETDGPAGAAYLARILEQCLGATPILVVEQSLVPFAEAALSAAGLIVSDVETARRSKNDGPYTASVAAVLPFTTEWSDARAEAAEVFDTLDPRAVVSVEMPGANAADEFHNVTARLVPTDLVAKADALVREAADREVVTIGIGDGGNELGFGYVADAVRSTLPKGEEIAPVTDVDVLVVSSISNWGAVGVGAAIAAVTNKPEVLRTVDLMRITDRLSELGAIDGLTAYVDSKNDGTNRATNEAFTEILASTVEMHLGGWNKG